ncbi:GDSL esterase/lipase [Sesamum angolense]|uniref:GDSL esterase/lipase n=1 Tax=Sesamum angolense TaxID=2727404 RepID=A0AAE1X504_9LAMI|nr:GDSL esterase/lipase [Sesamum angolense]
MANFVSLLADDATPVIFVLGDSTADVGTNNFLHHSKARANFPHNGVDFPKSQATGRFSNGFNTADLLAKRFGLKRSPPPFLFLRTLKCHCKKHLFKGVNFASGGSGLLDITGSKQTVVPLSEQITQFASVRDDFTATIGPAATEAILSKSLFFISIGSNDIFQDQT